MIGISELHWIAVAVATVAAFVIGSTWYVVFAQAYAEARGVAAGAEERTPPWKLLVEVARCLLISLAVSGVAAAADVDSIGGGLVLGLSMWLGFPLVVLSGAVLWENVPIRLAAIHLGDWLVKLMVIGGIVGAWR